MSLDIHKSTRVRIEPLNGFALVHGESRQLDEPTAPFAPVENRWNGSIYLGYIYSPRFPTNGAIGKIIFPVSPLPRFPRETEKRNYTIFPVSPHHSEPVCEAVSCGEKKEASQPRPSRLVKLWTWGIYLRYISPPNFTAPQTGAMGEKENTPNFTVLISLVKLNRNWVKFTTSPRHS